MATKIHNRDIDNAEITGAVIKPEMGIYSETSNYAIDDEVWWDGYMFSCISTVTGTHKDDLSKAPNLDDTHWKVKYGIVFLVISLPSGSTVSKCLIGAIPLTCFLKLRVFLSKYQSSIKTMPIISLGSGS